MDALASKEFNRLTKAAQDRLLAQYEEDLIHNTNKNLAKVQKKMLQMLCIDMHDYMGMSPDECLLALANMKEIYRFNSKIKTEAEQEAWLDGKMVEIFGEGGYPYEYIDKLEEL